MQKRIMLIVTGIAISFMIACQANKKDYQSPDRKVENAVPPIEAAFKKTEQQAGMPDGLKIGARKFIQSGAMEFETVNTQQTTEKIEEAVVSTGGVIIRSHIKLNEQKAVTEPISTDSVKKLLYYKLENDMTVRVPDTSLRRFMAMVEGLSRFTFSRNLDAEDVSVQWLSGGMKYNLLDEQAKRREDEAEQLKGDKQLSATDMLEEKENSRDASLVSQVQLADNIRYSTVQLKFYQPLQLSVQYLVNDGAEWAKGPGFWKRAGYAFAGGWAKCREVLLFLISIWWLAAIFALAWIAYRKWIDRISEKLKGKS